MKPRLAAAVASCLALAGCAFANPPHQLDGAGQSVRLVERRVEVKDCRWLTTVQGHAASVFETDPLPDIENDARNQAGFHGGNRIIRKPSHELIRNADFRGIIYDVYLCPEGASGPSAATTADPASEPAGGSGPPRWPPDRAAGR